MAAIEHVKREVIFLFGAGASVDAGIPDTYRFVKDFELRIEQDYPKFHEALLKICEIREKFNEKIFGSEKRQVDVEQLLDTLRRLIEKEKDPLLDFFEEKKFCSTLEESSFLELKTLLENFIREKVIVKEEEKLGYLKELLKFDTPIEIYSTNYDTCIEQLSYLNHRRYTDGFDVYWNGKNFEENYDIKHYKMHGSVIWYQNKKTKECVKIPVHGFIEGKSVDLKLIYGEEVEPLLIYPAQKAEYVEPLTDLQLMFKQRLFSKDTKVVVVVGYSFRDDYIIHMLWDAARVNENLHVILISPDSQEISKKLEFIDKEVPSRICDRIVCLPYPFSTIISKLKNGYIRNLLDLCRIEKENIDNEKVGGRPDWQRVLRIAIDCEFMTKAESMPERVKKNWSELDLSGLMPQALLHYAIKGLLHSVATADGIESKWIDRVNKSLEIFDVNKLQVVDYNSDSFALGFDFRTGIVRFNDVIDGWIDPVVHIWKEKLQLLGSEYETKLEKAKEAYNDLGNFREYISIFANRLLWERYLELRSKAKGKRKLETLLYRAPTNWEKVRSLVICIERKYFENTFGETCFQLKMK